MATEESGSSGEVALHAASEGPGAELSSTGSCDRSFHDPDPAAEPADSEVSEEWRSMVESAAKISAVCGVCA